MPQFTIEQAFQIAVHHHKNGRLPEAEEVYRQILAEHPKHPGALHLLGVIADQMGQHDAAVDLIRQALVLFPEYPEAYNNLGNVLRAKFEFDEAVAVYQKAIVLKPLYAEAYSNLGNALKGRGDIEEAIAAYRQAIALQPQYAEAHNNLGNALFVKGDLDGAITAYRQALIIHPRYAEAYGNLSNVFRDKGELDEAVTACHQAMAAGLKHFGVYVNLGNILKDRGELSEAIAAYRQAVTQNPHMPEIHANLLYATHFHSDYDARAIAEEHRLWNQRHGEPLRRLIRAHANDRNPGRRLRIGYVSGDFREHSVGRFLLPLLVNHDKTQVEIFAYAQVVMADAMTQRLHSHTDCWRNIVGFSDDRVDQMIRQDQIDILIDLAMHTAGNRLLVFARKPAPVQVTYLAYCAGTGLTAMDYRLSDPYMDPSGEDESIYTEKTIRLPETYWCYEPSQEIPEINRLPALDRGFVTFGCLNNFCKVNEAVLEAWGRIMRASPKSKLVLHSYEGSHRRRALERLEREGIARERVQFSGGVPLAKYLELYHEIDIALDTFPYGGGTTTCDALWMGVPVVSLVGKTAVGRGGLSILSNIGLAELAARSQVEYVRIASELAGDLPRLEKLRSTFRQRMKDSPLMDGLRFAHNVENAYRQMWQTWCAQTDLHSASVKDQ